MKPEQFIVWISGYLDLSEKLTDRDCKIISALGKLSALDFCYWLSGSFECGGYVMDKHEIIMQDHLKLVFDKMTPNREDFNINLDNAIRDYKTWNYENYIPFDT